MLAAFASIFIIHCFLTALLEVIPPDCESLDHTNLYSESSALSFAFNSGIIDDIMGGEGALYTVNGRMSSGIFDFSIKNTRSHNSYTLSVHNSQLEIDAGYENRNSLCIVEAKNIAPEDFLIRQLFYPCKLWQTKVSKPILCVFLVYSNDIFTAFKYKFTNINDYNSIQLLESKRYAIASEPITLDDIAEALETTHISQEPEIPFPQANSFERVIDFLSILAEHDLSRDETTAIYEFNERQTNYYSDACRYLGLVEKYREDDGSVMYRLTTVAKNLMCLNHKEKNLRLVQAILSRQVFNQSLKIAIENARLPSNDEIVSVFRNASLARPINETTIRRRTSTVRSWVDWILSQCE